MKKIQKYPYINKFYIGYILIAMTIMTIGISCKKELKAADPLPLIYSNLYLVGDATPAGWNIDGALKMTVNPTNAAEFTWTGPLGAGEIKFPTQKSWNADFFVAESQAQSVNNSKAQIALSGNPDLKWKLNASDAGNYKITVDMKTVSVTFQKQ